MRCSPGTVTMSMQGCLGIVHLGLLWLFGSQVLELVEQRGTRSEWRHDRVQRIGPPPSLKNQSDLYVRLRWSWL